MGDLANALLRFQEIVLVRVQFEQHATLIEDAYVAAIVELRAAGVSWKELAFAECKALGLEPSAVEFDRICGRLRAWLSRRREVVTRRNKLVLALDLRDSAQWLQEVRKMQKRRLIKRTITEEFVDEPIDANLDDFEDADDFIEDELPDERLQPRAAGSRSRRR